MLIELGDAEGDQAIVVEAEKDLEAIRAKAETMQVEGLLSGEADGNDCYLEVHAGAGGTEAQDWAEMLLRMYTRWAERRGFQVEWLDARAGQQAGLTYVTLQVSRDNASGGLTTARAERRRGRPTP